MRPASDNIFVSSSPETNPATFEQPLYHDLHAVIQEQLRGESDQA
jgi:hypothetical protein